MISVPAFFPFLLLELLLLPSSTLTLLLNYNKSTLHHAAAGWRYDRKAVFFVLYFMQTVYLLVWLSQFLCFSFALFTYWSLLLFNDEAEPGSFTPLVQHVLCSLPPTASHSSNHCLLSVLLLCLIPLKSGAFPHFSSWSSRRHPPPPRLHLPGQAQTPPCRALCQDLLDPWSTCHGDWVCIITLC